MLCSHLVEMKAQGFEQNIRKHGDAVVLPLAIAHDNLVIGKVEVLDPQAHDFHQAQTATVHDLCHYFVDTVHFLNDFFGFVFGKDSGDTVGFGGTNGDKSLFIQLDIEDIAVQKENGANRLIPPAPTAGAVWVEAEIFF